MKTPKPQPDPHTLPEKPPNTAWTIFGPQLSVFFLDFRSTFSRLKKSSIFRLPPKRSTILETSSQNIFCFDFDYLLETFWHQFSMFHDSPKFMFRNEYNAKCLFLLLKAFHFGIKNPSKNHVCSRHLPGHPFLDFMLISNENCRFWNPFKIQWAPKWDPKSIKWRPIFF